MLLLDRAMPGLDGLELCRRDRRHELRERVNHYIILVSGHGAAADIATAMDAGADDYLIKPYHPEELRLRIRTGERIIRLERALLAAGLPPRDIQ